MMEKIHTAEAVTIGHPDKICDILADSLLDAYLKEDPHSRVAIEVSVSGNHVWIMGEVASKASIPIQRIVRDTILEIGYDREELGFNGTTCQMDVHIIPQSSDIASIFEKEEYGAGDQGIMFGYAVKETGSLMPLPITLSQKLVQRLVQVRNNQILPYLRPDGKVQVSVVYENDVPKRVDSVVVSSQHAPHISLSKIREDIVREVIRPVLGAWLEEETKIYVNPAGPFVIGGPMADSGHTGRKIMADTYGPFFHGGGSFSGKDATKVDRSAAYYARYVAKHVVEAGYAEKCMIEVSYAIGKKEPLNLSIDTFGTNTIPEDEIERRVKSTFSFKPSTIRKELHLENPIYKKTALYGHFGYDYPWEKLNKLDDFTSSHKNT